MQLKEKTYYKTRDGRRAYVAERSPFATTRGDRWIGLFETGGAHSWRADGMSYTETASALDLVEEWREPVRVSGFVNVYPDGFTSPVYPTRSRADLAADEQRIACIYIEGAEK